MHFLFYAVGAILIAWGVSDVALNVMDEGTRPLIVTYGGAANAAIGLVLMGVGRLVHMLQNTQNTGISEIPAAPPTSSEKVAAGIKPEKPGVEPDTEASQVASEPVQADLLEPELGPLESPEPEPAPDDAPDEDTNKPVPPDRGKIVKEGDIRGYPFHLYENGEIELKTGSGWHTFSTIEDVQSHIAAEMAAPDPDQDSEGK